MTITDQSREQRVLEEIAPAASELFERHLASERTWAPHDQIDWGSGTPFKDRAWSAEDYPLPAGVRSAIYVNLLTEDNLPYYTVALTSQTPEGHPLREWNQQWTMEEDRHSTVMRDWVHTSRCIDPDALEAGRRVQMQRAIVPKATSFSHMISYVAFQERATQIAHRNTASRLPKEDRIGRGILGMVAGDETKHYVFYRDLALAGYEIDPSLMLQATRDQLAHFAMPGTGIPGFTRHSVRIAREGIYGLEQFLNDVVLPVVDAWGLDELGDLDRDGEVARQEIDAFIAQLHAEVGRMQERQQSRDEQRGNRAEPSGS